MKEEVRFYVGQRQGGEEEMIARLKRELRKREELQKFKKERQKSARKIIYALGKELQCMYREGYSLYELVDFLCAKEPFLQKFSRGTLKNYIFEAIRKG